MSFKPILFSTEMVRAILEGRKTQTRRILKPQPGPNAEFCRYDVIGQPLFTDNSTVPCRRKKGDVLWVRETWIEWDYARHEGVYAYKADFQKRNGAWERDTPKGFADIERVETWKPSIFMPKSAARIFLEVMDVRVERLQNISHWDAQKEGVHADLLSKDFLQSNTTIIHYVNAFKKVWIDINGEESWTANPWVWCLSFQKIDKPANF